jgi:hypothetical protein
MEYISYGFIFVNGNIEGKEIKSVNFYTQIHFITCQNPITTDDSIYMFSKSNNKNNKKWLYFNKTSLKNT